MQHSMSIEQVISRARAIGLSGNELARMAGLQPSTLHRARQRGDCTTRTLRSLQQALEARETALAAHLNGTGEKA